jgi:hypothetical protein
MAGRSVTFHAIPGIPADGDGDPAAPFVEDRWELYNVAEDPSETRDLAADHPEKLQELIGLWYVSAGRYDVLPLHAAQMKGQRPSPIPERSSYTYSPGTTSIDSEAAVNLRMRPFTVIAPVEVPVAGADGVLIAQGGQFGGWALSSTTAVWSTSNNYLAIERHRVSSDVVLEPGRQTLGLQFEVSGDFEISPQLTTMGMRGSAAV